MKTLILPGEKIYLSGDSGYLGADDNLYYKGRMDNQFKLRGFRVELGEIEEKLLSHPAIEKCVVLPKKNNEKDIQLVAFLVTSKTIHPKDLKAFLKDKLPDYMIPNLFAFVDKIPLNHNGKTDRKALLAMKIHSQTSQTYVAPRNEFEKTLQHILEQSLNVDHVGIDDDILEIGADSLTLMKISVDLLNQNYKVNIQDFYEYKTIRQIYDHIHQKAEFRKTLKTNIYYHFSTDFSSQEATFQNVLLTGATGFLGIHILQDLLENTNATIYCLVRDKNNVSAEERLQQKYQFYFDKDLSPLLHQRVQIVKGNLVEDNFEIPLTSYHFLGQKIDTVFHAAARVDHYGDKSAFHRVNVDGTKHILDFCRLFGSKLNYISTISVSGNHANTSSDHPLKFDENCLYIGQNYENNIYVKTKFQAEYYVYQAMQEGIPIAIYRLGNIMSRFSDGKFQENYTKNAFFNRLESFIKLQRFPASLASYPIEFSPVDSCAQLIVEIALKQSSYGKVFHVMNNHSLPFSEVLNYFNQIGYPISIIPDKIFYQTLTQTEKKDNILGIINDITSNYLSEQSNITIGSDFTTQYAKDLNFTWPVIDKDYFKKFFDHLNRR